MKYSGNVTKILRPSFILMHPQVTCTPKVSSETNDTKAKNLIALKNYIFCSLMGTIPEIF